MNSKFEQEVVGQRLRSARETLGLTQEDVATALGIQRTSVIAMEAGKRNVSAVELRRLARIFRRDVAWLLGEVDDEDLEGSPDSAALFRATASLSPEDKEQVLRFAQFLAAGETGGVPPVRRKKPGSVARRRSPDGSKD